MDLSEIEDILERMARMDKRSYKRKPKAIDYRAKAKAKVKTDDLNRWADRLHLKVKLANERGKDYCTMIKMGLILS
jgi:hypothetical protein